MKLYAWSKDKANNVSLAKTATVNIMFAKISTVISTPKAVSTISIAGISSPIICGIDLQVTYPRGTTYVKGVASGATPVGTSLIPVDIRLLDADVTVLNGNKGFGSGEIAKINYETVPPSNVSSFGVTILKVFDCSGKRIE